MMDPFLQAMIEREQKRLATYGEFPPLSHGRTATHEWVFAGGRFFRWSLDAPQDGFSPFRRFLIEYTIFMLGRDWFNEQRAKPIDHRHVLGQWIDKIGYWTADSGDSSAAMVLNGPGRSFLSFGFDLLTFEQSFPGQRCALTGRRYLSLREHFIQKCKIPDIFQSARYELYAATVSIRSGLRIWLEDEYDGSTPHPEFIGIHKFSQDKIAIEAKSCRHQGVLGFRDGTPPTKEGCAQQIRNLVHKAMRKSPSVPYIIFVDLNLPPGLGTVIDQPWIKSCLESCETLKTDSQDRDGFNAIFFTNCPYHYGTAFDRAPVGGALSLISLKPRFALRDSKILDMFLSVISNYRQIPTSFEEIAHLQRN